MVKNHPANGGDVGSIPGLGRPPGEGNGNPLYYSCLRNPMDRGAWQATVHGGHKKVGPDLANKQQQNRSWLCFQGLAFSIIHLYYLFKCLSHSILSLNLGFGIFCSLSLYYFS